MKNIAIIVIISVIILIVGNALHLPITVILFAIFAVASNLLKIGKKQKNKQEKRKFQEEKDLRQDSNVEEFEILENLKKHIEKVQNTENMKERKNEVYESKISYDYNKVEEKKHSTQENYNTILEQQEYYNKKLQDLGKEEEDIKSMSKEKDVYAEGYNSRLVPIDKNKKRLLSNLSVEEAVIYSAILTPKRFNYTGIGKN